MVPADALPLLCSEGEDESRGASPRMPVGSPEDRLHELCRISELLEAAEHGEASINGSDHETSPAIVDATRTPLQPQGPSPYHFQSGWCLHVALHQTHNGPPQCRRAGA